MNLDLKIVAITELSFLESVPRSNHSRKDVVRVEFMPYQLNKRRMKMIRRYAHDMACLNCESLNW